MAFPFQPNDLADHPIPARDERDARPREFHMVICFDELHEALANTEGLSARQRTLALRRALKKAVKVREIQT